MSSACWSGATTSSPTVQMRQHEAADERGLRDEHAHGSQPKVNGARRPALGQTGLEARRGAARRRPPGGAAPSGDGEGGTAAERGASRPAQPRCRATARDAVAQRLASTKSAAAVSLPRRCDAVAASAHTKFHPASRRRHGQFDVVPVHEPPRPPRLGSSARVPRPEHAGGSGDRRRGRLLRAPRHAGRGRRRTNAGRERDAGESMRPSGIAARRSRRGARRGVERGDAGVEVAVVEHAVGVERLKKGAAVSVKPWSSPRRSRRCWVAHDLDAVDLFGARRGVVGRGVVDQDDRPTAGPWRRNAATQSARWPPRVGDDDDVSDGHRAAVGGRRRS